MDGHVAILDAELRYDAMDVVFDSVNRDPELSCDLLIAEMSVRDQPQNLDLATCQLAAPPRVTQRLGCPSLPVCVNSW